VTAAAVTIYAATALMAVKDKQENYIEESREN